MHLFGHTIHDSLVVARRPDLQDRMDVTGLRGSLILRADCA